MTSKQTVHKKKYRNNSSTQYNSISFNIGVPKKKAVQYTKAKPIMNEDMFVVIVDTRGMEASCIDGYEEHACTRNFFDDHVLSHPEVRCIKSKVAELCGLEMKVYFHGHAEKMHHHKLTAPPEIAIFHEERDDIYPSNSVNGAATLLTFDPRTGYPEYQILGKAHVVVDFGDYPLSSHQVWGLVELISEARDFYYCDPDHIAKGRKNLLTWCLQYREQEYGPLAIYEPRVPNRFAADEDNQYYRHRHFTRGIPCPTIHKEKVMNENDIRRYNQEYNHNKECNYTKKGGCLSSFFG